MTEPNDGKDLAAYRAIGPVEQIKKVVKEGQILVDEADSPTLDEDAGLDFISLRDALAALKPCP